MLEENYVTSFFTNREKLNEALRVQTHSTKAERETLIEAVWQSETDEEVFAVRPKEFWDSLYAIQIVVLENANLRVSNRSKRVWEVSGILVEMRRKITHSQQWSGIYNCERWSVYTKDPCSAVPKVFEIFNNTLEVGWGGSPFYLEAPVEILDLESPAFQMLEMHEWMVRACESSETFSF